MNQRTARQDPRANSEDEDTDDLQAPQPGRGRPADRRADTARLADDGATPGEPDEGEFELIGDDDLSDVDLGPAAPNFTDPDAPSGQIRKITRRR